VHRGFRRSAPRLLGLSNAEMVVTMRREVREALARRHNAPAPASIDAEPATPEPATPRPKRGPQTNPHVGPRGPRKHLNNIWDHKARDAGPSTLGAAE
jgi:hypothetical protein